MHFKKNYIKYHKNRQKYETYIQLNNDFHNKNKNFLANFSSRIIYVRF